MGMTTGEAAKYLGISRQRVNYLIGEDKIQARKHGHVWDIDPASVEAYNNTPRRPGPPKGQGGRPRKDRNEK